LGSFPIIWLVLGGFGSFRIFVLPNFIFILLSPVTERPVLVDARIMNGSRKYYLKTTLRSHNTQKLERVKLLS